MSLHAKIASAIKQADSSYFFEDYNKQAKSVMQAIEKSGYILVPKDLPGGLCKDIADNHLRTGKMKPEDHVRNVYETVLAQLKK